MKLTRIINQNRRDFSGEYECEDCGNVEEHFNCYDDANFHDNVTPKWKCQKCGKSSNDLGIKNEVHTKYPEGFQV